MPQQRRCRIASPRAAQLFLLMLFGALTVASGVQLKTQSELPDSDDSDNNDMDLSGVENALHGGDMDGMLQALSMMHQNSHASVVPIIKDENGNAMYDWRSMASTTPIPSAEDMVKKAKQTFNAVGAVGMVQDQNSMQAVLAKMSHDNQQLNHADAPTATPHSKPGELSQEEESFLDAISAKPLATKSVPGPSPVAQKLQSRIAQAQSLVAQAQSTPANPPAQSSQSPSAQPSQALPAQPISAPAAPLPPVAIGQPAQSPVVQTQNLVVQAQSPPVAESIVAVPQPAQSPPHPSLSNLAASTESIVSVGSGSSSATEVDRLRTGLLGMRSTIDALLDGARGASLVKSVENHTDDTTGELTQQYQDIATRVTGLEKTATQTSQQSQEVARRVTKLEEESQRGSKLEFTQTNAGPKTEASAQYKEMASRVSALQKENEELKKEVSSNSDRIKDLETTEEKEMKQLRAMAKQNIQALVTTEKEEMAELSRMKDDNARLRDQLDIAENRQRD